MATGLALPAERIQNPKEIDARPLKGENAENIWRYGKAVAKRRLFLATILVEC